MQDIEFIPIPRQTETIHTEVTVDRMVVDKMWLIVACIVSLLLGIVVGVLGYVIF